MELRRGRAHPRPSSPAESSPAQSRLEAEQTEAELKSMRYLTPVPIQERPPCLRRC